MNQVILDIIPCTKPRMTQSDRWKDRKCCVKYWTFKDELKTLWGDRLVPETFHVIFVMPIPKSLSKKKRLAMNGKPHQQVPDADNLMKGFKDALLKQDSVIWDERATKIWGEKGQIIVRELEPFTEINN